MIIKTLFFSNVLIIWFFYISHSKTNQIEREKIEINKMGKYSRSKHEKEKWHEITDSAPRYIPSSNFEKMWSRPVECGKDRRDSKGMRQHHQSMERTCNIAREGLGGRLREAKWKDTPASESGTFIIGTNGFVLTRTNTSNVYSGNA